MQNVYQNEYVIGLITGLISGLILTLLVEGSKFVLNNKEALLTLVIKRKRKYAHLSGVWFQYHLTFDSSGDSPTGNPIWVGHKDEFHVSPLMKFTGVSENTYRTKLSYRMEGKIDNDRLIFHYLNIYTSEEEVTVVVDNILSGDTLQGVWIGYNFDKRLTTGPIIFSRKGLQAEELDKLIEKRLDMIIQKRS